MKTNNNIPEQNKGNSIDWGEIHRRVEKVKEALIIGATPSLKEKSAILKERARALATESLQAAVSQESLEIVTFRLASETYGIESGFVREVYPLRDFTPLPGVPSFVLGIINLRGQIISVVDLKKFFNLPEKGLGDLNKVIIIRNDRMEFGILADVILGTRQILIDTIQESPPTVTGIGAEYIKGVTEEHLTILDGERILGDDKIVVQHEID